MIAVSAIAGRGLEYVAEGARLLHGTSVSAAARLCDRLVLLRDGSVVADGPPDAVLTPQAIEAAFDVRVHVYRDPSVGCLALSVLERRPTGSHR